MHVIIVGGGADGAFLASRLISEGENVSVIESDPTRADVLRGRLDALIVTGNGANPSVQRRAGASVARLRAASRQPPGRVGGAGARVAAPRAFVAPWPADPLRLLPRRSVALVLLLALASGLTFQFFFARVPFRRLFLRIHFVALTRAFVFQKMGHGQGDLPADARRLQLHFRLLQFGLKCLHTSLFLGRHLARPA